MEDRAPLVSHEHWPVKSEFVEKFGETETLTETCQCGSTRVVHYTHDPKIIWLSATTMTIGSAQKQATQKYFSSTNVDKP